MEMKGLQWTSTRVNVPYDLCLLRYFEAATADVLWFIVKTK